jgi:hypothetical protein
MKQPCSLASLFIRSLLRGSQELVNTFIANEDQNFSLFNYVNEQVSRRRRVDVDVAACRHCLNSLPMLFTCGVVIEQ